MAGGALQQFWSEVRRRHVPRVAAYYIAGAWVLAQAGSLLLEAFDSPHYTRYVIAALAAGLPVALVLAWIFDITPQRHRAHAGAEGPVRRCRHHCRRPRRRSIRLRCCRSPT